MCRILMFIFFLGLYLSVHATKEETGLDSFSGDKGFSHDQGIICEQQWNDNDDRTETCCISVLPCSDEKCQSELCSTSSECLVKSCHPSKTNTSVNQNSASKRNLTEALEVSLDLNSIPSPDEENEIEDDQELQNQKLTFDEAVDKEFSRQSSSLLACSGIRRRKEFRSLTRNERIRFLQAMIRLINDRDERRMSDWDRLVALHRRFASEAHGGIKILPWHRLFLLVLENLLRRKDPRVTLPYWNWLVDTDDPALSTIWSAGYLGGARTVSQPIPNGPFRGLVGLVPSVHRVTRNFNSGRSGSMERFYTLSELLGVLRERSYQSFSDGLESAHNLPHIAIGGDMGRVESSPNDPAFYLHHAFIDLLFAIRQDENGRNEFSGSHRGPVSPSDTLEAFRVPISYAVNLNCVRYVSGGGRLLSEPKRNNSVAVYSACDDDKWLKSHFITREACENGRDVLVKSIEAAGSKVILKQPDIDSNGTS